LRSYGPSWRTICHRRGPELNKAPTNRQGADRDKRTDPPRQEHAANSHSPSGALMVPAVSRAYLSQKLTRPFPTKDGGTLRTVLDARAYMFRLSKDQERSARWQRAAQ